jgi:hypothetical protein
MPSLVYSLEDVFPGVEHIGNNRVRDPAFEKLLKKQIQAKQEKVKKKKDPTAAKTRVQQ